jgi:hypothetical protein
MIGACIKPWARLCSALLLLSVDASALAAEHHGRVLFNGFPVPGVSVTATSGTKQLTSVTDAQVLFQFLDLQDGEWTIRVEMQGFAPEQHTVRVDKATPASGFELKMLSLPEVLASTKAMAPQPAVVAAAPALKPREKSADKVEVPAPSAPASDAEKSADGLLINGSENNASTSKYSISQAFGSRRRGAKGLYTGSLGAQVSASPFDARPYSLTGLPVPKASYSRINGVATLGGPLRIPHLIRNGPTTFVGYQWTRDNLASTLSGLVPTEAQRSGDLSDTVTPQGQRVSIVDPATGQPMAGPVAVSTQARALLALYPLPNLGGNTRYNYQTQVLTHMHADALQSRLDRSFGRRDQVYGGFAFRSVRSDGETLFHFRDTTNTLGIDSNVNWSHRFPHQMLFDAAYRFTR